MTLLDVIARIKDATGDTFRAIGGAADLAALDRVAAGAAQAPAVYVMPVADQPRPNATGTLLVSQVSVASFSTVTLLRDVGDVKGVKQLDALDSVVRPALRAALLGWTPASAESPIEFAGGGLIKFEGGELWWNDQWRVSSIYQS